MRLQPQRAGGDRRIDAGLLLTSGFVTRAMDLTMVAAARPGIAPANVEIGGAALLALSR